MLIPVIYFDHSHDLVEGITITSLIRDGKIRAFKRSTGWVEVGRYRIRKFDCVGHERMVSVPQNESHMLNLQTGHL
ncbi:MAG: GSU3473 family protein [Geobacteraceae bacterium]